MKLVAHDSETPAARQQVIAAVALLRDEKVKFA